MQTEQAIFGTIPDFHRVQMLGVGDCSWYGDIVGGRGQPIRVQKHMAITSIRDVE